MYKSNPRKVQPYLISNVQDLPDKQRARLEKSWSGVFYREFYSRVNEQAFAILFADIPSRPNAPINELVSLEFLKDGKGWTDEEMYDHYLYDLQTRHALGLDQLGEEHLELRTVYNFRQRLSKQMQETGVNLLDKVFDQVTDQPFVAGGDARYSETEVVARASNRAICSLNWLIRFISERNVRSRMYSLPDSCFFFSSSRSRSSNFARVFSH